MGGPDQHGFRFLFRTDRGMVDRATWWRASLPLAGIAAAATLAWRLVRPYTVNGLDQPPLVILAAYLYLLAFSFGMLVLLICEYNLSAKRFADRGLPRALAGILPLTLLLGGAYAWYQPRAEDVLPGWTAWIANAVVIGVLAWNVVELGVRSPRRASEP